MVVSLMESYYQILQIWQTGVLPLAFGACPFNVQRFANVPERVAFSVEYATEIRRVPQALGEDHEVKGAIGKG